MRFILSFFLLVLSLSSQGQKISFSYSKTPLISGFRMEGYWVWGGSVIRAGGKYHLFVSRWPKTGPFPEGYRKDSEIVRAVSRSPYGPFEFSEVIIGERDSSYWDSNMAHNPTIHRIGNEFVLVYIGSDFTTLNERNSTPLRRIGYASAKSIEGPWKRSAKPVIDAESNNPAILEENGKIKLLYRDLDLRVWMAEADDFRGPYKIVNDNVWPGSRLEDFYLFRSVEGYHIICEDNMARLSGHSRWGVNLFSEGGIDGWKAYDPVVAYDHDIVFENDSILHCIRRERPQLLIISNRIRFLYNGVYDGNNSWCQPVKLDPPINLKKK